MKHLKAFLDIFHEKTGCRILNSELIANALTHDSIPSQGNEFERMEFLGDACLEMVIAAELVTQTQYAEGKMSQLRSRLTRKESLAEILKDWKVEPFFQLGRGMNKKELPDTVYADYLESFFGALYLDQGFDTCRSAILKIFSPIIQRHLSNQQSYANVKSQLQELTMAKKAALPCYTILQKKGPDHAPTYYIELKVLDKTFLSQGPSIKDAELKAAGEALDYYTNQK